MYKKTIVTVCGILIMIVAGCASGPRFSEISGQLQVHDAQKARLFFFRTRAFYLCGVQPEVMLTRYVLGEPDPNIFFVVIGNSVPGGFFFADVPSGDYSISCGEKGNTGNIFPVASGNTYYFQTNALFGGGCTAEVVDPSLAMGLMEDLSYQKEASGYAIVSQ